MTIKLLSKSDYKRLLKLQKNHPILTFNNNGYEYLDKSKFSPEDVIAFDEVTDILRNCITGFSRFDNFKIREKSKIIVARFQYNWTADDENSPSFTGVGYLELKELHKGFNK